MSDMLGNQSTNAVQHLNSALTCFFFHYYLLPSLQLDLLDVVPEVISLQSTSVEQPYIYAANIILVMN